MMFTIAYLGTDAEARVTRKLLERTPKERLVRFGRLLAGLLFFVAFVLVCALREADSLPIAMVLFVLAYACTGEIWERLTSKACRRYRKNADPMLKYTVSDEGITAYHDHGHALLQWSAFTRARANDKGILLHVAGGIVVGAILWLPARVLADLGDYARLLDLVASKVPTFEKVR